MIDAPVIQAFRSTIGLLESAACRYAVVGALARAAWGTGRTTTDVDFAVSLTPAELSRIKSGLQSAGLAIFRQLGPFEPGDELPNLLILNLAENPAVHADLLVAKTEFEVQAIERRRRITIAGKECWVVSPEDLIVYKLVAHRGRDREDIADVLRTRALAGERLDFAHIDRWAAEWGVEERWALYRPNSA